MSLLTRKRSILAKIESSYGVDPTPTGGANAILVKSLNINPMEATLVGRDNIKPYLGNNEEILAAVYNKVDFEVEIAGSGTAGVAPAYGPLLRACGMSELILATAHTDTAQAGSTTSITLATTGSASNNAYQGMTITIASGTGSGQSGIIQSYVGSTKVATMTAAWTTPPDATSVYAIAAQVVYQPVSSGFESNTMYFNQDGVLHKLLGARGTVSFSLPLMGIPMMKFAFTGLYVAVADGTAPTVTLSAFKTPLAVNNQNTGALNVMGYAGAVMSDFSFDLANTVVFRSLVGGSESITITERKPAGSISQEATTVAAKDWWASIKAVTTGAFSVTHGTSAGNKVKFDAPKMQLTKPAYQDKDGISMLQTSANFIPVLGNDELYLSVQ